MAFISRIKLRTCRNRQCEGGYVIYMYRIIWKSLKDKINVTDVYRMKLYNRQSCRCCCCAADNVRKKEERGGRDRDI